MCLAHEPTFLFSGIVPLFPHLHNIVFDIQINTFWKWASQDVRVVAVFQVLQNLHPIFSWILDKLISLKMYTILVENYLDLMTLLELVYSFSVHYFIPTHLFQ